MRHHQSLFVLLALTLAAPAAADVTIRYAPVPPSERGLVLEADGAGRMRAEIAPGQLIIIRDGDVFIVTPGADRPNVSRLDDFLAVATEAARAFRQAHPLHGPPQERRYRLNERGPATVGPWHGTRLAIEEVGARAPDAGSEWVVSDDPALAEAARIVSRFIEIMYRIDAAIVDFPPELPGLLHQLAERGTPLRMTMSETYRLESVGAEPVAADRFALPAPVLTRDQLRARQAH